MDGIETQWHAMRNLKMDNLQKFPRCYKGTIRVPNTIVSDPFIFPSFSEAVFV